ncbi:hypothetical protein GGX14DRAFT_394432 [Mycena pura]|uniref:Uncharacterized protein n=1 Tax=Mycena pura TaxID=153505 RepID=A0AAD6VFW8_9AGAR|nr:hypothetical protein GGX14DRAFT_394432 [Mycena pura]
MPRNTPPCTRRRNGRDGGALVGLVRAGASGKDTGTGQPSGFPGRVGPGTDSWTWPPAIHGAGLSRQASATVIRSISAARVRPVDPRLGQLCGIIGVREDWLFWAGRESTAGGSRRRGPPRGTARGHAPEELPKNLPPTVRGPIGAITTPRIVLLLSPHAMPAQSKVQKPRATNDPQVHKPVRSRGN